MTGKLCVERSRRPLCPQRLFLDDLSEHTVGRFHPKANRFKANERAAHFDASLCQTENDRPMAAPSAPQRQKERPLAFRLTGRLLRSYKPSRGRGPPPSDGRNHSGHKVLERKSSSLSISFLCSPPPLLATKRIISTAGPNCTSAAPVSGHFSSPPIQPLRHAHLIAVFLYFDETFLPFSHQKRRAQKQPCQFVTKMHGMTSADWHFIQHLPQTTLTTANPAGG